LSADAGGAAAISPPPSGKRRRRRALLIAGLAVVIAGAAFARWKAAQPVVIQMGDAPAGGYFDPAHVTIAVGTAVRWTNVGDQPHDATNNPARAMRAEDASYPAGATPFDSGMLAPGQSFTYTFAIPGTYKYVCLPHELGGMTGEVIVR
jgi:plastocyanin